MTVRRYHLASLLILLLIGCFVAFLGWAGHRASTRGSEIADRDYYSKGLKYNTTLVEKRAASVLGWELALNLEDRRLSITLYDRNDQLVGGGQATLRLYPRTGQAPVELIMTETSPGNYVLDLPESLSGENRARLDLLRDGARLNRNLLLNL